jgi:hypothetical protein
VPWHSYTSLFGNSFKASLLPAQNDGSLKFLIFHKLIFRNGMNGDGTVKHNSAETVPQGRIYFISAGDKIKIGFSTRPLDRLKALQTAHPGCLEIIGIMHGAFSLERRLHEQFSRYWVRGEWFRLSPEITRYIEANTLEGQARAAAKREAYLIPQEPRRQRMANAAVAELRRHLRMRQLTAAPVLRPHLSTLEQMLKSWDGGGNREHLAGNIERTIRAIETLRQPAA